MRSNASQYELVAPGSLDSVLALLAAEPGAWTPMAGGTELMVALGAGRLEQHKLVSLWGINELRQITASDDWLSIGAGATFTDIRQNAIVAKECPLLARAASWTGAIANQNRGTLGGNIVNASPAADSPPVLLVYEAEIELVSAQGARHMPYSEFHLGYKRTVLKPQELVKAVHLSRGRRQPARDAGTPERYRGRSARPCTDPRANSGSAPSSASGSETDRRYSFHGKLSRPRCGESAGRIS